MSRAKYPLQAVRDQRQREQDAAQEALAARLAEQAAAERKLAEERATRERIHAEREDATARLYEPDAKGRLDIADITRRREGIAHLGKRLAAQDEVVASAQREVEAAIAAVERARADLVSASLELAAIDKHHERWKAELKADEERREEQLAGEVALSAFVRREEGS